MILDPENIVKKLLLPETAHVADLGAGTGAFTVALANCVRAGKVYAIDLQRGLLSLVVDKLDEEHIQNVEIVVGNLEEIGGTKLRDDSLDAVILVNTLFQIKNKDILIREIARILKPNGKLILIDWVLDRGRCLPLGVHAIDGEKAGELFTKAGFVFSKEISVGEYHYALIFTLPK